MGSSKDLDPTIMAQPLEAAQPFEAARPGGEIQRGLHGSGFRIGDAVVTLVLMDGHDLLCLSWESPDLIHESQCRREILGTEGALSVRILQAVLVESEEETKASPKLTRREQQSSRKGLQGSDSTGLALALLTDLGQVGL